MLSAEELHRRGLALSRDGRYRAARTLLRRAHERATAPDTIARVRLSLGYVEAELAGSHAGLELCEQALTVEGVSAHVRGLIEAQVALLLMRSGDGDGALARFAAAIPLLARNGDVEALARSHLNRGLVYLQRGDAHAAAEDSRRAGELNRSIGKHVEAAKADHNLGYALLLAGDLVAALRLMESSAPALETLSGTARAVIMQDRAEVLLAAGMPTEARVMLEQASRRYGTRGLRQRQGEVELILAWSLVYADPRRAATVAARAERRFRQYHADTWALRAQAVRTAATIERGTVLADPAPADRLARELRTRGLHNDAWTVQLEVARALAAVGDTRAAGRRLARIRPSRDARMSVRLLASEVRAELAGATGRRTTALDHARAGLAALLDWQAGFGSLELQSSLVNQGQHLVGIGLILAVESGDPALAFEWSERARGLASRVTALRRTVDPEAARALAVLRGTSDDHEAERLRAEIRQRAWYDAGSGRASMPAPLAAVAETLAEADGTMATYLRAGDRLHCLVTSARESRLVALPESARVSALLAGLQADLDMAATDLPSGLRRAVRASLESRLAQLDEVLVAPVAEHLDTERIVVVPPIALAGTPWSMLPRLRGRAVTVPRSATLWLAGRAAARGSTRVGLVAGPRVERAEQEVAAAAVHWRSASVLTGPAASAAEVSRLASSVGVLHVAAHGRHSADNPLFSGLELADGTWYGYDIDQLSSIPETVLLSACELGRSSSRWGAETLGMTVAWLHAGARCVVASPAAVADDVACEVLGETHAALARGMPPAAALAAATAATGDLGRRSPFLCFGIGW